MKNNIEYITPLLKFDDDDNFYIVEIIQRKKENKNIKSNNRIVKRYTIDNMDSLLQLYTTEMMPIANVLNARVMIHLNARSYRKAAFLSIKKVADTMLAGNYKHIGRQYHKACSDSANGVTGKKYWLIDIDVEDIPEMERIIFLLNNIQPVDVYDKIKSIIPSKSGYHIITSSFNTKTFKDTYPNIEVHKNNPTNLFIP